MTEFWLLLSYCAVRELFFWYNTQKLLNKLMSRNFYDFQMSEKVGKIVEKENIPRFPVENDIPEDMAHFSI